MMEIIAVIILVLVFSRLMGELFERGGMPAVLGEVMAGIILGPMVLNWLHSDIEGFDVLVNIGLFFLVFTSGLEFSLAQIKNASKKALPISFMGNNIAFFSGLIMALLMGYGAEVGIFIGATFSLTALPVAMRVLGDMKKENTPFGRTIITSAVYDDLFSMFILGMVFSIALPGSRLTAWSIINVALKISIFLLIIFFVGKLFEWKYGILGRFTRHYIRKFRSREGEFAVIVLFGMSLSLLAEFMGISFILGAFYGGVLIGEKIVGEKVYMKVKSTFSAITFGFSAPIFFVYTGLNFQMPYGGNYVFIIALAVVFISVAMLGKTFGAYLGARLSNIPHRSALGIGIALNSRGLMGLIIATYGIELGIIDHVIFSLLTVISIATTIISPIMLARYMKKYGSTVENLKK